MITKEDFLAGIKDIAADIADPDSDWNDATVDIREIATVIRPFDPELASKFDAIVTATLAVNDHIFEKVNG